MKYLLRITLCLILLSSCKNKKEELINQVLPDPELGAFNLVFPDNNLICTEGQDVGINEVSINFMWNKSDNATSYSLDVKNLSTDEVVSSSSTTLEKAVTLPRDTQFSWTVTALLDDKTIVSDTWSFYSEGTAQENFAPFPAAITAVDQTNGFVEISWEGSDLDNDIDKYDLYFGTDVENLDFIVSTTSDSGTSSQPITYGTNHSIEVITTDDRGNSSSSIKTINF